MYKFEAFIRAWLDLNTPIRIWLPYNSQWIISYSLKYINKQLNQSTQKKKQSNICKGDYYFYFFSFHCSSPGSSKLLVADFPEKALFIIKSNFAKRKRQKTPRNHLTLWSLWRFVMFIIWMYNHLNLKGADVIKTKRDVYFPIG